jgi:hypothetical protein
MATTAFKMRCVKNGAFIHISTFSFSYSGDVGRQNDSNISIKTWTCELLYDEVVNCDTMLHT